MPTTELERLAKRAGDAAALLRLLSNEQRLLILCHLASEGELSVGALQARLTLGQSALSQHLAKLRDDDVVATRRDGQAVFYTIRDERARALLGLLYDLYCKES